MAQPTIFPEMRNVPLGAGDNPNTNDMPCGIAINPTMVPVPPGEDDVPFYMSKWKFSDEEKMDFLKRVQDGIKKAVESGVYDMTNDQAPSLILATVLTQEYDHVWLAIMHTPVPSLILAQDPYKTAGYIRVNDMHSN